MKIRGLDIGKLRRASAVLRKQIWSLGGGEKGLTEDENVDSCPLLKSG